MVLYRITDEDAQELERLGFAIGTNAAVYLSPECTENLLWFPGAFTIEAYTNKFVVDVANVSRDDFRAGRAMTFDDLITAAIYVVMESLQSE